MQRGKLYGCLLVGLIGVALINHTTDTSANAKEVNVLNKTKLKTLTIKSNKQIQCKTSIPYYNPYNVGQVSNIGQNSLHKILEGTRLQEWTRYFIQGEEKYGINALFIVGLVAEESGWGNSNRSNNGSYNLVGHAVYNNISRGSYFESYAHCIDETFRLIAEDYYNQNGKYHNGKSIWNINKMYSSNKKWSDNINSIVYGLMKKV